MHCLVHSGGRQEDQQLERWQQANEHNTTVKLPSTFLNWQLSSSGITLSFFLAFVVVAFFFGGFPRKFCLQFNLVLVKKDGRRAGRKAVKLMDCIIHCIMRRYVIIMASANNFQDKNISLAKMTSGKVFLIQNDFIKASCLKRTKGTRKWRLIWKVFLLK